MTQAPGQGFYPPKPQDVSWDVAQPLDLAPADAPTGYPQPAQPTLGGQAQTGGGRLIIGWIMFAVAIPVNSVISVIVGIMAFYGLIYESWWLLALLAFPLLFLAGAIAQLIRLVRRKPSIVLGALLLAPVIVLLAWNAVGLVLPSNPAI